MTPKVTERVREEMRRVMEEIRRELNHIEEAQGALRRILEGYEAYLKVPQEGEPIDETSTRAGLESTESNVRGNSNGIP